VRPSRSTDPSPNPEGIGNLHHFAFTVSRATYNVIAERLSARGIKNTGPIDRGFMDSIYFRDPNGQMLEIAVYKFEPPAGYTHADVLALAHNLRVEAGDYAIANSHLADALAQLVARRAPQLAQAPVSDALAGEHDPRAGR
jgi:hypothetical protein